MSNDTSARRRGPQGLLRHVAHLPFFAFVGVFLLLPTLIVIVGAFRGVDGGFTTENFKRLTEPNTIDALGTSLWVSLLSAIVGSVVGGLAAYVLVVGGERSKVMHRIVTAVSSVLAQFGGVMLAFAFIATVGINGIGTQLIAKAFGYTLDPNWISSLPGLVTIYAYFQIPLMIIVFVPAVAGLRPQWREVTENMGGTTWTYWSRVAGPLLWPAFAGSFLLLFANAFSAYATAAALFAQRSILLPLMIQGALRNEQDTSQNGFAQVIAFLMVIVVSLVMALYAWLQKRTSRWL